MKKLLTLLLLAITSMAFAQTPHTDAYLKNYTDSLVRKITLQPKYVANTFQFGWDSKVSILSPKLGTSSTVGYVWTATNTSGAGSWQAPAAGTVTAVNGTTNRITSTGGATPTIDISSTFETLLGKVANPLSQFASTTSSQFAGVISDETGTGSVVFSVSPALTGTPTAPTASGGTNTTQIATTAHVFVNYQPKDTDLTTIAQLTPSNNDFMQFKSGGWANRTVAQVKTDLGITGGGSVPVPTTGDAGKQLRVTVAEDGYELYSPNLDPTTTTGDLIQRGASALDRLAAVATGNVLISGGVGTVSSWGKVGLTTHVSGQLGGTNGGTGVSNSGTITVSGNVSIGSSTNTVAFTTSGNTSIALPTSGTLAVTASPTFTGTPVAPTATVGTNTTQISTTAFVRSELPYVQTKDFGATGDGVTNDYTAIQNAINTGKSVLLNGLSGTEFLVSTGLILSTNNQFLFGDGQATVKISTAITALTVQNCSYCGVQNINISGTDVTNQKGMVLSGTKWATVEGVDIIDLDYGFYFDASATETIYGVAVPVPTKVGNSTSVSNNYGMYWVPGAEYYDVNRCIVTKNQIYGMQIKAGNVSITGSTINSNDIGIFVDGIYNTGNTDHGQIVGNKINHNRKAGLWIKSTQYSMHVTGNDIWANIGDGTGSGNFGSTGTSVGVYLQSADAINFTGNVIARNKVNMGYDGLTNSVITGNTFITDNGRTTSHLKSYGFASEKFIINGLNVVNNNAFVGSFTGGGTKKIEPNTTAGKEQGFVTKDNVGTTQADYIALTSGSTAFDFDGSVNYVYMTTGYTGTFTVRTGRSQQASQIYFNSISGATKAITFANVGTTTVTSFTPGATVSSLTVTLNRTGAYTIIPLTGDNYAIFGDASDAANTAASNELMKSDGTNAVPSGLLSSTAGNLNLGLGTTSGTDRSVTADGSGSNINNNIISKGSGNVNLIANGSTLSFNAGTLSSSSSVLFKSTAGGTNIEGLSSVNLVTTGAASTGNIAITTGVASAGNSGDVALRTGTATGTRGVVRIQGTVTNDNATSGDVGENFRAIVSTYTNYTTTATYQNITSITLTPGDYDISANGTIYGNGATVGAGSDFTLAISTTTASASGSVDAESISRFTSVALNIGYVPIGIPTYRVSVPSTTTYYLNTLGTFSAGNPQFVGSIRARRIR